MEIKVTKFQLYPINEPTDYAIGVSIKTINDRSFYRDTLISLDDAAGKTDEEILEIAWSNVKADVLAEVERLEELEPIVGKPWCPSTLDDDMVDILAKRAARESGENDGEGE